MVLTRRHAQVLIVNFENLSVNPQVHIMAAWVKFVLISFERNIHPGDPLKINIYNKAIKETEN